MTVRNKGNWKNISSRQNTTIVVTQIKTLIGTADNRTLQCLKPMITR